MPEIEIAARELRPGDRVENEIIDRVAYSETSLIGCREGLKAALVVKLKSGRTVELYPSWPVKVDRQTPATAQLEPFHRTLA